MAVSCYNHALTPLLILLTATTCITSTSAARPVAGGPNSIEFIKTSCSATTYPRLCYTTLATHASIIQTSPLLLAHTALSVTLNNTRSTSGMMTKLSQSRGMSPRGVAALHDCMEELSDSVDELRKSLRAMSQLKGTNYDFGLTMNDIQTWVSAAMTNEDTCTEGFSESETAVAAVDSDLKSMVRGRVVKMAHLTSNALALVNNLASSHG